MTLAAIPSPSTAVWHLGPFPVRAYALCIVLGIVVACLLTEVRMRRRGAAPGAVLDIAVWAVPFGIVGARIYHVLSSPQAYFGADGDPVKALFIWEGGLSIWGAVAGGALGAWLATRQLGIPLRVLADAVAVGLPLAQAIGRLGNWFNNELYGGPTTLPWGLRVHDMDPDNPGRARAIDGEPVLLSGLYHPTFLYEALWNVGVALLVLAAERRWKLGRGRAFALYVMGYTVGRFWIEIMRTDEATRIFGVRLNVFTSVLVFIGALIYFVRVRGPQEFLVPLGAARAGASGADAAGVAGPAELTSGEPAGGQSPTPAGYRVVTEEPFREYERTGRLADPPGPDDPARDDPDRDARATAVPAPGAFGPDTDAGTAAGGPAASGTSRTTDER